MRILVALVLLLALPCCGDDATPGAMDAATASDAGDARTVAAPQPPALDCPAGWREVTTPDRATTCDPYPEGGAAACGAAEAHFVGETACTSVGAACPAGSFSETLPTDRPVLYVLAGATGGDGTVAMPFGGFSEFGVGGRAGTVVALGRGTYDAVLALPSRMTLVGACPAETTLTSSAPALSEAVVTALGPDVELRDLSLADSVRPGIWSDDGGTIDLDGIVFRSTEAIAIVVGESGMVSGRDVAVRDTRPAAADLRFGRALTAEMGGAVTIERAVFEANRDVGLVGIDSTTRLMLSDVAVRDTAARMLDRQTGRGLALQEGAAGELARVLLSSNRDAAVFVSGTGSSLSLSDAVVRHTAPRESDEISGRGLQIQSATTDVARTLVAASHTVGVYVGGAGAVARIDDVVVRDTASRASDGLAGRGLNVENGGTLGGARVAVEGNRSDGIFAAEAGTTVSLTDVLLIDTESIDADGTLGRGLGVQLGASVEMTRARIENSRELGAYVANDSSLTLTDALIADVRAPACADAGCTRISGVGAGSYLGSTVALTRFAIHRTALCGVQLVDAEIDLAEGEIAECRIGACVQVGGYDLSRLMRDVSYRDNEVSLDATDLPVPEPSTVIGS